MFWVLVMAMINIFFAFETKFSSPNFRVIYLWLLFKLILIVLRLFSLLKIVFICILIHKSPSVSGTLILLLILDGFVGFLFLLPHDIYQFIVIQAYLKKLKNPNTEQCETIEDFHYIQF